MNITYFDFNRRVDVNATTEYYELLRSILKIKKLVGKNLVRIGKANDGGYVMVNDFKSKIAYSFGIAGDVSWDLDMANRGYEIFMYDPTIDGLPQENARFHFFKEGIAGFEFPDKNLNTLESFIKRNGHEDKDNMILKMDVEGAEWEFLSTVSSELLSEFDQMVFEFHDLTAPKNQSEMFSTLACIKKVTRTHSLVHLHANNNGSLLILDDKILFPDVLELTYVKTSNYELVDDENIFLPNFFDQPNHPYRQDIPLGFWNREFNNVLTIVE
ncbi:MAG: FkbM family methyltransferase [Selenomonadaceae bacterium]|nr:FkbM family methyltransferase [Selenomonadaceae bacterium]